MFFIYRWHILSFESVFKLVSGNQKWRNICLSHCDVALASVLSGPLDPAVQGTTIFRNVWDSLPTDKMLNHRRFEQ